MRSMAHPRPTRSTGMAPAGPVRLLAAAGMIALLGDTEVVEITVMAAG